VADAVPLERLIGEGIVPGEAIHPPDRAVIHWPAAVVSSDDVDRLLNGRRISLSAPFSGNLRLYAPTGAFLALGRADGDTVQPYFVMRRTL
jgi:hypothetical protein